MWRMNSGDRVLTDKEWDLFSDGLDLLVSYVEDDIDEGDDSTTTGAGAFDRLTAEQKLVMLADVATALRDPAVPMPGHTAANEATIAAVIYTLQDLLHMEIEEDAREGSDLRSTIIRGHLLAVAAEAEWEGVPRLTSRSRRKWEFLLESFEGGILWDTDHALGDMFLDLPPDQSRLRMEEAGIVDDYYLETPDEPNRKGLAAARQKLARLFGRPVPDDSGLYWGLNDNFTGLQVGPMTEEQFSEWEGHPWVERIGQDESVWDCPYARWKELFSGRLPKEAFEACPAVRGVDYDLPADVRVEPLGEKWVIRDESGSYWLESVANAWGDKDVLDEKFTPIRFETAADARSAYVQAGRMYAERAARREAALARDNDYRILPNSVPTPDNL